jgi:hypothetical protein
MSQIRTDARINGAQVAVAWIIALLTVGYMLPWAVAATRGKPNALAIALINLLLGWTMVGWVVALVMACTSHQVVSQAAYVPAAPPVWVDPGTGHTLTMNPATQQPMRIDPVTGAPWVEPSPSA